MWRRCLQARRCARADIFTEYPAGIPPCKTHGAWLILWAPKLCSPPLFHPQEHEERSRAKPHDTACEGMMYVQVEWVGQPVGLVVAHSRAVAERAAALVKVRGGVLACLVAIGL